MFTGVWWRGYDSLLEKYAPRLLKCYPYGTGFLIRTHELYGFDLPSFDVIAKKIKMGMTSMYEVIIMQIGESF